MIKMEYRNEILAGKLPFDAITSDTVEKLFDLGNPQKTTLHLDERLMNLNKTVRLPEWKKERNPLSFAIETFIAELQKKKLLYSLFLNRSLWKRANPLPRPGKKFTQLSPSELFPLWSHKVVKGRRKPLTGLNPSFFMWSHASFFF
jgi:hypothetical protein